MLKIKQRCSKSKWQRLHPQPHLVMLLIIPRCTLGRSRVFNAGRHIRFIIQTSSPMERIVLLKWWILENVSFSIHKARTRDARYLRAYCAARGAAQNGQKETGQLRAERDVRFHRRERHVEIAQNHSNSNLYTLWWWPKMPHYRSAMWSPTVRTTFAVPIIDGQTENFLICTGTANGKRMTRGAIVEVIKGPGIILRQPDVDSSTAPVVFRLAGLVLVTLSNESIQSPSYSFTGGGLGYYVHILALFVVFIVGTLNMRTRS